MKLLVGRLGLQLIRQTSMWRISLQCNLVDLGCICERRDMYRLLTSAAIPRPVAFVSTVSTTGVRNLAPMRYGDNSLLNFPFTLIQLI